MLIKVCGMRKAANIRDVQVIVEFNLDGIHLLPKVSAVFSGNCH